MDDSSNLQSPISSYQSPFTTRYGSQAMRAIWSERNKRLLWRRIWVALSETQCEMGIVSAEQAADVRAHAQDVNAESIARALEIERDIQHDLMAEVRAFAEQCTVGGGIIHLGATSMDVEDNADALRLRDALDIISAALDDLISQLAAKVEQYADLPTMAFTHLQPAEPTTVGYRLAQYLQDLLMDRDGLRACRAGIRGKGFKGAVGTSASYLELGRDASREKRRRFAGEEGKGLEERVLEKLGIGAFPAATQTYPRKQDWLAINVLAGIAQSLYKFAFDLRVLQSPPIGEWAEPFGAKQVGSSAMPFKRNPINSEKIDSLARYIAGLPHVLWDNAAHSLLERTLDDSANRRVVIAEAFLAADEIIRVATRIITGLRVNEEQIARNMRTYGPFAATERLLMALVKAGADRQQMHELIRGHSLAAWAALNSGSPNPLIDALCADPVVCQYMSASEARTLLDASDYVGDAPQRARALAVLAR
ncbi:MAG TPA: adenylosuccinate lyase [Anaerolineae bacterium]